VTGPAAGAEQAGVEQAGVEQPGVEPTAAGERAGAELMARAELMRLSEPGDGELTRLIDRLGAPGVLAAVRAGTLASERLGRYRTRLAGPGARSDLRLGARLGARLVGPGDEEWPAALDELGGERPIGLWVRGAGHLAALSRRAVAVVGARACTAYGEHVSGELGAGLAERGWTVVSGAAYGIDGAAHRGALAVDGLTVAVLACGVDVAYPSGHEALLRRIEESGAVVSELPLGARPTKLRFLQRNRLIAALGRGTVVVEAALRSGAGNTARHAADLGREVMAVPGPVTSAMSAGCHELLRTRNASLVTDAADVLDLVGELGVDASPTRRGAELPHDCLDELALRVLDALPVSRYVGPAAVATSAGLEVPTVVRVLSRLLASGFVQTADGGWRRCRRSPPTS
jgi:DNA processing protein